MDFHALSRRELQVLCKRNNIRANMTNVAMAEALQRQDLVIPDSLFNELDLQVNGINYETASIPTLVPAPTVTTRLAARRSVSKTVRVILRRSQRKVTRKALDQEPKGEDDASKMPQAKLTDKTCEDGDLDEDEEWALNDDDSAEEIGSTDESDEVTGETHEENGTIFTSVILKEFEDDLDSGADQAARNELLEDLKGINLNMLRATYKEFKDK